jgi:hypothetical protein
MLEEAAKSGLSETLHTEVFPVYVKYRFRQIVKTSFDQAKKEAVTALDSCPPLTLQRFCNRASAFACLRGFN